LGVAAVSQKKLKPECAFLEKGFIAAEAAQVA
jgi:hypothetical protein